ncbi:MAG: cyclomaltodextrinase N-terminal domain-containing protein [Ignavibacteriales bacterium]|nr:cyclomaltodextrinase N-terminal domain-containing protein [Ignavibacteriales bacterium]
MKRILAALLFFSVVTLAQSISINRIDPPNWWVGMKHNKIQLMVYGNNLNNVSARFDDSKIKVTKVHKIINASYAFIDIEVPSNLTPKDYQLILTKGKEKSSFTFPILKREDAANRFKGFTQTDVIYLIMPDRFANGDVTNDSVVGYSDNMQKIHGQGRAGGDLLGVINKLDYLKDFGITTTWLTPVIENNTFRSYHGYAATDFYKVDPRLGTNALYKKFVEESHSRGMKVVLDHVANHLSDDHPWFNNLPTEDWLNGTLEKHLNANHHKMVFSDIHADSATIKHVEQGWFVRSMPDINQRNPFVQNYITQNTIWWMEFAGIDGIREDTYPYSDQKYMARWAKAVKDEFPTTNIVGEVWTGDSDLLSTYQQNNHFRKINSNLPAVTDFALRDVLIGLAEGRTGTYQVYNVIAKDYLYADPTQLVTFADNHDVPRVAYFAKSNLKKEKLVYDILLTTRGIPQLFYGSEIGLVGTNDDGTLRMPFPGGFPNDKRDAFTEAGRDKNEDELFNHIKELLFLRKTHPALATGTLTQYPPANDVYVYFRTLGSEKIMVVLNNSKSKQEADFTPMSNMVSPENILLNLRTNEKTKLSVESKLSIDEESSSIYKVMD